VSAPLPLVLGASAVVASPVAKLLYEGDITLDAALLRVTVVVVLCWVLLSLACSLFFTPAPRRPVGASPARPARPAQPAERPEQAQQQG
jgi:hypothetical protein